MPKQNKEKPEIEDIASEYLDGEALDNVLGFVKWLKAGKMKPTFGSKSKIGISYTTRVLYMKLFHGYWYIWISGKAKNGAYIEDFLFCKELKEIVRENLPKCESCSHACNNGLGYMVTVCGKKFEKICGTCTVRFRSPNAEALDIIKNVIEKRNNA